MITISILGLDEYITGRFSREATPNLAKLLEIEPEEIVFFAPKSYIFHAGVEQTSWQGLIIVSLPEIFRAHEKDVATYLLSATADFLVNLTVKFHYFASEASYSRINEEYPRFIKEEDIVDEYDEEGEDDDNGDDEEDNMNDNQPYMGNIFEDFEEKAREHGHDIEAEDKPEFECCEGEDCDGENCQDEDCDCHHHHHN